MTFLLDLTLSRKLWVVAEMIKQEVIAQSARSGMCVDPYNFKTIITLFPKNIYRLLKINGQLRATEQKELLPNELKYIPTTPSKVNLQVIIHSLTKYNLAETKSVTEETNTQKT